MQKVEIKPTPFNQPMFTEQHPRYVQILKSDHKEFIGKFFPLNAVENDRCYFSDDECSYSEPLDHCKIFYSCTNNIDLKKAN